MELIIRVAGTEVSLSIQPGDTEQGIVLPGLLPAEFILLPDCVENDTDRNGDCDGRVREVVVLISGTYGKLSNETTFLCGAHRRMAAGRRTIRVLA